MHTSDYTAFAPLRSARRVLPWLLHLLWRPSLRARLGRCCAPFAAALVVLAGTGLTSCRVTRHVPEGASVVSRVWLCLFQALRVKLWLILMLSLLLKTVSIFQFRNLSAFH